MKNALKIILPPISGLIFSAAFVVVYFFIEMKYGGAFDFSYHMGVQSARLSIVIFVVILVGMQALLVSQVPHISKVLKVVVISTLILLLGMVFSLYSFTSSVSHSIIIGIGILSISCSLIVLAIG